MILNVTCWQNKNGISLPFYLGTLGICKTYVPLVEDIHICISCKNH